LDAALLHAERLVEQGAAVLDVGGESTRPGSEPVSESEEIERVIPVIGAIRKRFEIPVSVDTQKFEVARLALEVGADIVNDVSGGADPRFATLPAKAFILMHRQGDPKTMQLDPQYPDGVVPTVRAFLEDRVRQFESLGVSRERIWLDPGIGFGKLLEHNLSLLKHLRACAGMSGRIVVGVSRKSFLSRVIGEPVLTTEESFQRREAGGIASVLWCLTQRATVFRVHDVGSAVRAIRTWEAIDGAC
jgi:dihydropteroate synthase